MEHTKGELHNHGADIHIFLTDTDEKVVLHTCIATANKVLADAPAIAEHIVKYWNSHDALLAAIRKMRLTMLDYWANNIDEGVCIATIEEIAEQVVGDVKEGTKPPTEG